MNKRQKKKKWKKETPLEYQTCGECKKGLNYFNKYHMRWGTCNATCYAKMVGANLY